MLDLLEEMQENIGKVDLRFLGKNQNSIQFFRDFFSKVSSYLKSEKFERGFLNAKDRLKRLDVLLMENCNSQLKKPEISNDLFHFKKASPLVKESEKIKCPYCLKTNELGSKRNFKAHLKKFHPEQPYPEDISVPDETKVTCLMQHKTKSDKKCLSELDMNQLYRHLNIQHGCTRPKDTFFRGFVSYDGRKTYQPCFRMKGAPDPSKDDHAEQKNEGGEDSSIEIDDEEVHNQNVDQDGEQLIQDIVDEHVSTSEDQTKDESMMPEPKKRKKLDADNSGNLDSHNFNLPEPDKFSQSPHDPEPQETEVGAEAQRRLSFESNKVLEEENLDSSLLDMSQELKNLDSCVEVSPTFGDTDESEDSEPSLLSEVDHIHADGSNFYCEDCLFVEPDEEAAFQASKALERLDSNGIAVEGEIVKEGDTVIKSSTVNVQFYKRIPLIKDIKGKGVGNVVEDSSSVTVDSNDKKDEPETKGTTEAVVKDAQDKEELDENYEDGDQQLPSGPISDIEPEKEKPSENDCLPDFKSQAVEDDLEDSDNEDGDNADYTLQRITNKMLRHQKRSTIEEVINVCELPENAKIISEFKEFMLRKYKLPTYKLTQGYLFSYETSFLMFEMKKDKQFTLSRNLDIHSPMFLELSDPSVWEFSVAGDNGRENVNHR